MTTSNDFAGAVLVLVDPSSADDTAAWVSEKYYPDSEYHYTLTETVPSSLPDNLKTKITETQSSLSVESSVLTFYPWAQAEANHALAERPTHGKIPS